MSKCSFLKNVFNNGSSGSSHRITCFSITLAKSPLTPLLVLRVTVRDLQNIKHIQYAVTPLYSTSNIAI